MSIDQMKFYSACEEGDLPRVKELSNSIDVNWRNPDHFDWTGLSVACRDGKEEIVRYLLDHPQIDVNKGEESGWTPLSIACWNEQEEIVKMLVGDERIDVNKANKNGWTPLWHAYMNGREDIVKILLASGREIDATKKENWDGRDDSPAEIAKKEVFWRGRGDQIAELVEEYVKNPRGVRERLRKELKWITKSAEIFGLGALLCDGFLKIQEEQEETPNARFFKIFSKLHLDVQMILINRSQGSTKDFIAKADQNLALNCLIPSLAV